MGAEEISQDVKYCLPSMSTIPRKHVKMLDVEVCSVIPVLGKETGGFLGSLVIKCSLITDV